MYSFAFLTFYVYTSNSQCDPIPAGLIAQLVEHYTGIAEVMIGIEYHVELILFSNEPSTFKSSFSKSGADIGVSLET